MIKRAIRQLVGPLFGFSAHDLYVLRSMRHYWWLYARAFPFSTDIPVRKLDRIEPESVTAEDVALCQRAIAAYHAAVALKGIECEASPLWQRNLSARYTGLAAILESGDAANLAKALSSMFSSPFVEGIDSGILYSGRNWKTYSRKILDDLASLAEQLGVAPAESGMAITGQAFAQGMDNLVHEVERELGCSLSAQKFGAPYGLAVRNVFLTLNTCEYAYVAWRLAQTTRTMVNLRIVEIGAGYGGTAMFVDRLLGERLKHYTIADFPIVNVMQAYFLGKAYGGKSVALFGEEYTTARFKIVPGTAVKSLPDADVLFNQNSMPEMMPEVAATYLSWAKNNVSVFFSYNQETVTPDKIGAVTTVPDIMSRVGGFRRQSRNYSWLRPGYVEEVWARIS